MKNTNYVGT